MGTRTTLSENYIDHQKKSNAKDDSETPVKEDHRGSNKSP